MKVLIIGAGVIGVTTAYSLACRGHHVTVLDRQDGPGRETSFANGSLLHSSMPEPWNGPGCWRALIRSLGRSDSALQLRLRALPAMMGWGVKFLCNSRPETFERNTLSNLRLARHSLRVMQSLRREAELEYGRVARGSLRIFRNAAAFDQAVAVAGGRLSEGLSFRKLSSIGVVKLEPALAPIESNLAGAIHYDADEIGDAHQFCVALASRAKQRCVEFRFETEVHSLEGSADRVTGAISGDERFEADRYIVAAGSYSPLLLKRLGIRLPVQPAKGYSITLRGDDSVQSLKIPVIDAQLHAAVVPLKGMIRVAGTAEFSGYDLSLHPKRTRNLVTLLTAVLPEIPFDSESVQPWCGLRPLSPDGVPIIGPTPISNLWVSTGHGHLGWTMAAGSARLLADLLSGDSSSIDPLPYDPRRFISGVGIRGNR